MSKIQDTAYPQLKQDLSARELAAIYTPSTDECAYAAGVTARKPTQAMLLIQLKILQRLGHFEPLSALSRAIVDHVCGCAHLRVPTPRELKAYDASGSRSVHLQKIRDFIGVRRFADSDWPWLEQVAREAASTKQELEDIVNVLIEEIVRQQYELPGFTQLVRAARAARNLVNTTIFKSVTDPLSTEQRQMLDDLAVQRRGVTLWDQLKREPKRPTVREVAQFLEHIRWLKSLGHGLPDTREMAVTKRHQMMLEARALDAKDIRNIKPLKRYTLAVLLIQSQLEKATDDIASIFIKIMHGIDNQAEERLRQYRLDHAEQTDLQIGQFREVLAAMQEGESANERFMSGDLVNTVRDVLRQTHLDADHLELEITESVLMDERGAVTDVLVDLHKLGVAISIDDFGTGYSSLSYLKRYPISQLKIDKSFIRDVTSDSGDAALVMAIIAMGHSLNIPVIAEGIETEEQLAFLSHNHCDHGQGFHIGRPMPFDALLQWFADADHWLLNKGSGDTFLGEHSC